MLRNAAIALAVLATLAACGGSASGSGSAKSSAAARTPNTDQGRLLYCDGAGILHGTLASKSNGAATTQESAAGFGDAADEFNSAAFLTSGPNRDIYRSLATETARLRADLLSEDPPAAFAADSSAVTADIKRAADSSNC